MWNKLQYKKTDIRSSETDVNRPPVENSPALSDVFLLESSETEANVRFSISKMVFA